VPFFVGFGTFFVLEKPIREIQQLVTNLQKSILNEIKN